MTKKIWTINELNSALDFEWWVLDAYYTHYKQDDVLASINNGEKTLEEIENDIGLFYFGEEYLK